MSNNSNGAGGWNVVSIPVTVENAFTREELVSKESIMDDF